MGLLALSVIVSLLPGASPDNVVPCPAVLIVMLEPFAKALAPVVFMAELMLAASLAAILLVVSPAETPAAAELRAVIETASLLRRVPVISAVKELPELTLILMVPPFPDLEQEKLVA